MINLIENGGFLIKLLGTPGGQEVLITAINTWKSTENPEQTMAAARQKAVENGTINAFEAAIFLDGLYWLVKIAPLLYDAFKRWMDSNKGK